MQKKASPKNGKPSKKRFKNVILRIDGAVAMIQFNRPDKKNAMSPDLHRDMHKALDDIEKRNGIK